MSSPTLSPTASSSSSSSPSSSVRSSSPSISSSVLSDRYYSDRDYQINKSHNSRHKPSIILFLIWLVIAVLVIVELVKNNKHGTTDPKPFSSAPPYVWMYALLLISIMNSLLYFVSIFTFKSFNVGRLIPVIICLIFVAFWLTACFTKTDEDGIVSGCGWWKDADVYGKIYTYVLPSLVVLSLLITIIFYK